MDTLTTLELDRQERLAWQKSDILSRVGLHDLYSLVARKEIDWEAEGLRALKFLDEQSVDIPV